MALSFDSDNKTITIPDDTTSIDLNEVYSRSIDWLVEADNLKYLPPMRYSGYDPIPGGYTGTTFFMINDWKLVYNPNTTQITGVLFSDNYNTGYWTVDDLPIYPIIVAATVNTVYKEMGVSGLTSEESDKLDDINKKTKDTYDFTFGRHQVDTSTNELIVYAPDNTTEVARFSLHLEDGTQDYNGATFDRKVV